MTRSPASLLSSWAWAPLLLLAACGPGPVVNSFTASPDHIPYGESTRLSWDVKNANSVQIEGADPVPEGATGLSVSPTQTTTYTLTATGAWGAKATSTVTVTLIPKMQIVGGTYNAGGPLGLAVAATLRTAAGAAAAGDTVLTITPPASSGGAAGTPFTATCPGGKALCMVALPDVAPLSGNYLAQATVDGETLTATFPVNNTLRLPQAAPIVVSRQSTTTLKADWQPVDGATNYRVTPVDLSTTPEQPFGQSQIVTGLTATLTTSQPMSSTGIYGVAVEAAVMDLALQTPPSGMLKTPNISRALGRNGGRPDGWQYFDASRWTGDTLTVSFTNLEQAESLAIIVMNVGGKENAASQLTVTGTLPPPAPPLPLAPLRLPDADAADLGLRTPSAWHELERDEEARIVSELKSSPRPLALTAPAPRLPAPAPATTNFCVRQGTSTTYARKNATLKRETPHALFYVDSNDLAQYSPYEPGIWDTLQDLWESKIYPGDTSTFGAESDVDANGKLIIFITSELGAAQTGGILLGYYAASDVFYSKDTTSNCNAANGKGSNQADMFYLNGIGNIMGANYQATDIISRVYPDTLAHEFQHLINFNQHILVNSSTTLEDTWINEGLSMVAEEIGGYGWNTSSGRRTGGLYLDRLTGANLSYNGRSLTVWEGDPIGNYEGAHSFFRYYADRFGPQILGTMVQTDQVGITNLTAVLGLPFGRAYAEWTTAMFFSNEVVAPVAGQFDFKGANWIPLHTALQKHLNYVSLPANSPQALTLRKDGWNAFLTGTAVGGSATITLTTSETAKPTVVVGRFTGTLSR